jgi:preprotein translocase subunit SecY
MFMVGEGIMFGIRVFDDVIRYPTVIMIIVSSIGIVLIFKEKTIGYLIVILSILITLIIGFGHRMLWWPCEYCSF